MRLEGRGRGRRARPAARRFGPRAALPSIVTPSSEICRSSSLSSGQPAHSSGGISRSGGRARRGDGAGRATGSADIAGRAVYPGTSRARSPGRGLQFSRRCDIPVAPESPSHRSAYDFRVPCCRRRRGGCRAVRNRSGCAAGAEPAAGSAASRRDSAPSRRRRHPADAGDPAEA